MIREDESNELDTVSFFLSFFCFAFIVAVQTKIGIQMGDEECQSAISMFVPFFMGKH